MNRREFFVISGISPFALLLLRTLKLNKPKKALFGVWHKHPKHGWIWEEENITIVKKASNYEIAIPFEKFPYLKTGKIWVDFARPMIAFKP